MTSALDGCTNYFEGNLDLVERFKLTVPNGAGCNLGSAALGGKVFDLFNSSPFNGGLRH